MRLTPAQGAVMLICGEPVWPGRERSIVELMKEGHDFLVQITKCDYGYDLQAWHDHLKESREGGYTYGRNIVLPKIMQASLNSAERQGAAEKLSRSHAAKTKH